MARLTLILGVLATVVYLLDGFRFMLNEWRRWRNRGKWVVVVGVSVLSVGTPGLTFAVITNVDCSSPATVQTAIDAAASGDTLLCTADGSWTAITTVPGTKGLTIDLNGHTITRTGTTATALFNVTTNASTGFRLTNGTFSQSVGTGGGSALINNVLIVSGTYTDAIFRMDHLTVTSSDAPTIFVTATTVRGLIDNTSFSAPTNSEMLHIFGSGGAGWTEDVTPGTTEAVYIEDNVFTNNGAGNANSSVQSYDGARTVFRYNTMHQTQVDQHGTAGAVGARWFEIYENTFDNPAGAKQIDKFCDCRAGSGVIFNNHVVTGVKPIILREEDVGAWTRAYQIGSGYNGGTDGHATCAAGTENQSPLYIWDNETITVSVASGPIVATRDYFESVGQPSPMRRMQVSTDSCSTTYDYTPLIHPHPLQGSTNTPAPSPVVIARVLHWMEVAAFVTGMGWHFRKQVMAVSLAAIAGCGTLYQLAPRSYETMKIVSKDSTVKVLTVFNNLTKPRV